MGSSATPLLGHYHHRQFLHRPLAHLSSQPRHSNSIPAIHFNRRSIIFLSTSLPLLSSPVAIAASENALDPETPQPLRPPPDTAIVANENALNPQPPQTPRPPPDTTITDRVFIDFSICPNYFRSDRTLGDEFSACQESELLGRVVFGLYGKHVPLTVSNFKAMCTGSSGSSYKGTLIQKIFPGQFLVAGKQGRRDKGEVRPPSDLARNTETVDPRSFLLTHSRAGVLSLCLSENDDDEQIKLNPNYRNVEFLVTTGPGPCPQLDNGNIVFGTVLEGLDVVTAIASIPTYKPAERIRQFNDFAELLGDERAQIARTIWNKPLKTVYISDCGELKVAKPSLTPSLP
ncbi:peptidyl-prolyl cis-trans isomerase CYP28, chloroplastic [Macadamia integrifolia]|uniref:peptidyl-prolyl cis-trans isomerase CYP28, chloroplastic n=1 Tax=Macadamia integrifolia TaxID=60698 RepID=UPI001C4FEB1C|nr:peptidyl-prolyl cis-trans isomerase CYP28, chloroplastic [Macadamia integrifolia]